MVRIARVESRMRTAPSASDSTDVFCRLGRKRRRVRLLAWLTLLPASTVLPVISQRRDIGGGTSCSTKWRLMAERGRRVKELAGLGACRGPNGTCNLVVYG